MAMSRSLGESMIRHPVTPGGVASDAHSHVWAFCAAQCSPGLLSRPLPKHRRRQLPRLSRDPPLRSAENLRRHQGLVGIPRHNVFPRLSHGNRAAAKGDLPGFPLHQMPQVDRVVNQLHDGVGGPFPRPRTVLRF